ncbi:hypothetical protein KKF34_08095 [Myxococcota bacterium]|nr:hypothetical protein [Myxococcota bacterium]MBU1379581.1 hypothetical protein [Myxococcota bacterium]MBU1496822.1 hypothetical protein [Myxococcota bacterium]
MAVNNKITSLITLSFLWYLSACSTPKRPEGNSQKKIVIEKVFAEPKVKQVEKLKQKPSIQLTQTQPVPEMKSPLVVFSYKLGCQEAAAYIYPVTCYDPAVGLWITGPRCLRSFVGTRYHLLSDGDEKEIKASAALDYKIPGVFTFLPYNSELFAFTIIKDMTHIKLEADKSPKLSWSEKKFINAFTRRTAPALARDSVVKKPVFWKEPEIDNIKIFERTIADIDEDGKKDSVYAVEITFSGTISLTATMLVFAPSGDLKKLSFLLDSKGALSTPRFVVNIGKKRFVLFQDDSFLSGARDGIRLMLWENGRLTPAFHICCIYDKKIQKNTPVICPEKKTKSVK